mmetsp:Transcript_8126/g.16953  ORF Transcript_8126/g.16953 Transcript_8126/m.16953 type:complete len:609 (-) Transcript_8126:122-1948(-)|eukprot:CAMPEP_0172440378 /NCGR_PEP_ID=MMETSP1065-20121228/1009_1 /TAXON_ID=265537 /ORGANISM="Amphiprora paludosa, Strain CCMP125" /LENGTH=608 /DNA_ID=CAMNT_0013189171 /DNA_START=57 /DNA_END=1883 /DNA_ORIENTATION=-
MVSPKNVYQIDFTAVASGKRIASSKRRVRWRFGFANPEALASGETGTACRGEEHDVTLVWSITSGKRVVLADGQEVHYSTNRNGILDFSWTMRGNHVLKIVAHASPPMAPTPGWRQYDFFVDGQSFFTFPKVYRLGLANNDPRAHAPRTAAGGARLAESGQRYKGPPGKSDIANLEAPSNTTEEEAYLQAAIRESMKDATQMKKPDNASSDYGDLLDFGSVAPDPTVHSDPFGAGAPPAALPPSTTAPAYPPQPGAPAAYGNPPPQPGAPAGYGNPYAAAPPQQAAQGQYPALPAPAPAPNQFAFAPTPTAAPASAAPYGAPAGLYGAPEPPTAAPGGLAPIDTQAPNGTAPPLQVTPQAQQTPSSIGFASPPADFSGFSPQAPAPAPVPEESPAEAKPEEAAVQPQLTMNSLSGQGGLLGDGGDAKAASGSMADQAYARLAQMDTFTLGAKPQAQNPFEVNNNVVGGNKTLADIQSNKDGSSAPKEIMKSAPQPAGAMVVSGTQNGNWSGQYGQQPQMGGMPAYGQQPQMGGMQQPQMGGPPPLGQPQMGGMQQPQMGMQQPSPFGAPPQMGMQQPQMGMQQPQMGQPGQYPPPLQQQPFGAFGQQG